MSKPIKITLAHIERAAKWAIKARKAGKATKVPGDGVARFDMRTYFTPDFDAEGCGTQCCIMGAAALTAGVIPAKANQVAADWRDALIDEHRWGTLGESLPGVPLALRSELFYAMSGFAKPKTAPERVLKIIAKIKAAKRKAK